MTVSTVEFRINAERHARRIGAPWSVPPQDMSFSCEISTFRQNEQVRVVTRYSALREDGESRDRFASTRKTPNITPKIAALMRGGFVVWQRRVG